MRACEGDSDTLEWTQLEALYGNAEFASLIERARALLRTDMSEFERMLDERAYPSASQRLHRIKGTASFFSCDEEALAALHAAEKALALADPKFIEAKTADFHLAAGSPALGAGANLPLSLIGLTDFAGRARKGKPDLGAYQD